MSGESEPTYFYKDGDYVRAIVTLFLHEKSIGAPDSTFLCDLNATLTTLVMCDIVTLLKSEHKIVANVFYKDRGIRVREVTPVLFS
jgi:hypothetical protein